MTRLVLAPRAFVDMERVFDFLVDTDPPAALETGEVLIAGLPILETHRLVGRPAGDGLRELVISRGGTGYVALYGCDVMTDVRLILAIRHQQVGRSPAGASPRRHGPEPPPKTAPSVVQIQPIGRPKP